MTRYKYSNWHRHAYMHRIYYYLKYIFLFIFFCILFSFLTSLKILADTVTRSTSLTKVITVEGNVERIDYVDNDGIITYAADKHYATIIKTKSEHAQLDEYLDADGRPAIQTSGYYAVLHEYDEEGNEYKYTYLDENHKPIMISSGYSITINSFDKNGRIVKQVYLDTEGLPVQTKLHGYGCCKEYDVLGRNSSVTYIDENGNPMISGNGYAIIRRTFYESGKMSGKIRNEFYYDQYGKPISLSIGQYGVYKEYDELGRSSVIMYLDAKGQAMLTKNGYCIVKRTFYDNDSVKTEFYFDKKGNPVRLSDGQYGFMIVNGKKVILDKNGNRIFSLRKFLHGNQIGVFLICIFIVISCALSSRKVNYFFFFLYLFFIVYMTLMNRNNVMTGIKMEFLWSYKQLRSTPKIAFEILNNILLFVPLGSIIYRICPKKSMLLIPLFVSVLIELFQFFTRAGLCELDDVLNNVLGGIIGFYFCLLILKVFQNRLSIQGKKHIKV